MKLASDFKWEVRLIDDAGNVFAIPFSDRAVASSVMAAAAAEWTTVIIVERRESEAP